MTTPLLVLFRLGLCLWLTVAFLPAQEASRLRFHRVERLADQSLRFEFESALPEGALYRLQSSLTLEAPSWKDEEATMVQEGDRWVALLSETAAAKGATFFRVAGESGKDYSELPLVINEVMTRNETVLTDAGGHYHDWIELYNAGDQAIDLIGFHLSDDILNLDKWTFPAATIAPGSYLIVFASGGEEANEGEYHASFQLQASGESLYLSAPNGTLLDRLDVGSLLEDTSLGRANGDLETYYVYETNRVTPGKANASFLFGAPDRYFPEPQFSVSGGVYGEAVELSLSSPLDGATIRYTLDGAEPKYTLFSGNATLYTGPITIDRAVTVRAKAFFPKGTSATKTVSYVIGVEHTLPVISVAAEPGNFEFKDGYLYGFGPALTANGGVSGTFPYSNSNAWQDREVEVHMEFFEPKTNEGFAANVGMKIFGGWGSRGYAQKSMAVFARKEYGTSKIRHRLFPDEKLDSFESFVLRNSGNDNQSNWLTVPRSPITAFSTPLSHGSYFVNANFTLFRDAALQSLIRDYSALDTQAYRPAVLYINGDYWGIFNIREKLTEHYVAQHHAVSSDQVDLIEGYGSANAGTATAYNAMRIYIGGQDLSQDDRYQTVEERYLDIDNFIDYHLAVIYNQNFDIGNIKCWRSSAEGDDGRFRWMLYDQDYGFNLWKPEVYLPAMKRDYADYDNMFRFYTNATGGGTGWPNEGGRTLLLRKMLENEEFKGRFIRRCADLLNSAFEANRVHERIDEMAAVIRGEIPRHLARWSWAALVERGYGVPYKEEDEPLDLAHWERNVASMQAFGDARPGRLRQDLIDHFGLQKGLAELTVSVDPPESSRLQVNTLIMEDFPVRGTYFVDYPPSATVLPRPGYRLVSWEGATETEPELIVSFRENVNATLTARMERIPLVDEADRSVVISEIQYHPSSTQESGQWIELHNRGDAEVSLGGWALYDEDDEHRFVLPEKTLLAGAYLVIAANVEAFTQTVPEVLPVEDALGFDLGNGGDQLRLLNAEGAVIESFRYADTAPWPEAADGSGYTLERQELFGDPALPGTWVASAELGGTPGR